MRRAARKNGKNDKSWQKLNTNADKLLKKDWIENWMPQLSHRLTGNFSKRITHLFSSRLVVNWPNSQSKRCSISMYWRCSVSSSELECHFSWTFLSPWNPLLGGMLLSPLIHIPQLTCYSCNNSHTLINNQILEHLLGLLRRGWWEIWLGRKVSHGLETLRHLMRHPLRGDPVKLKHDITGKSR